jgi:ABC-2 type transport system permease protein
VLLLVIFGSIPSLTRPMAKFGGISFFNLYAPTLVLLVLLVLGLLSLPMQMASYREQGVLRRFSTTPVPASFLLGAQLIVNLAITAVTIGVILGVGAAAFGLQLPGQAGWFALSLILTIGAIFGLGLCVAARAGTPQVANGIGLALFYPLGFFAGLFVPLIEIHSNAIDQISKALPSGAAFNALHASFAGKFPGGEALGVLAAWAVVSNLVAVRWFRWDKERSTLAGWRIERILTRTVTVPGSVTSEQVDHALRQGLSSRFEVLPGMKIKGRFFGKEPGGPDMLLVTAGLTALWRAQVSIVRSAGRTTLAVRPGGDPLYSALGVARKVRRVLRGLEIENGEDRLGDGAGRPSAAARPTSPTVS